MADAFERLRAALAERYLVEREIGAGGMATVYLARDVRHDRPVALKLLKPELAAVLGQERFLSEIRVTAHLHHPHILPLFDSGAADGFLYYVMPHVEGESLRQKLDREKQLGGDEALEITRAVASALDYAHRHDVVHRDIKPENILLQDGEPVVADFGIALAVSLAGGERVTQTGLSLGTPHYMSPEQGTGDREVDGRSDIYALGCVLYEMLAGHPPFTGSTAQEIIARHMLDSVPSLRASAPDVPGSVEAAVLRALAKRPADRFASAAQFAEALRAGGITPTDTRPVAAVVPRRITPTVWVGAAAVAVVGVALVLMVGRRGEPPLKLGRTAQITSAPGLEVDPAISPDGKFIAYSAGPANQMHVYVRQIGGGQAIHLTRDLPGNHRSPQWSPDGTQLLVRTAGARDTTIQAFPALGGAPRRLASGNVRSPAWAPDGKRVAFVKGDNSLYVAVLDAGTEPQQLAEATNAYSLAWSPDGSKMAYVTGNALWVYGTNNFGNYGPSAIEVVGADGGEAVLVAGGLGFMNESPTWTPDGRGLMYVSDQDGGRDIYAVRLSRAGRPAGPAHRLTTGLNAHSVNLSPDGRTLSYASYTNTTNVWSLRIPAAGAVSASAARQITDGSEAVEGVTVSPDGRRLAFDSNRRGNRNIFTMDLPDGEPVQLTTGAGGDFVPSWSPDGRDIAFYSMRNGTRDLFVMSGDGGNLVQVTGDSAQDRFPDWSPDGRRLTFNSVRSGRGEVYVIDRATNGKNWGSVRQLTTTGAGNSPRWSPDGRLIAYLFQNSLRVVSPDGGEPRILVESANLARVARPAFADWAPDSRTIYYKAYDAADRSSFWAIPVAGGPPRLLVRFDDPLRPSNRPEFATDGKLFYFTIGRHESDIYTVEILK